MKFSVQLKPEFINELRSRVKEYFETNKLSKYGNVNLVLKTLFMLAVYLVPYALMMSGIVTSLPLIILCWIIMGAGVAGIGMGFMHDANHGTYSKNKNTNRWIGYSLYLIGGFPPTWQHQHNVMHHGFTNIEGHDEDINPIGILRLSPHKPLLKIHKYQHWYAWFLYGLMTLMWTTTKDFSQLLRYKKEKIVLGKNETYGKLITKLIITKVFYYIVMLALPVMILPVAWYWVVISFLAMHFTSGFILGTVFQTAHVVPTSEYPLPDEAGEMNNNWALHQLLTTSDFAPKNKVLSWLIGGLNFQVEHHLFPNISHVHYPKISHFVKELTAKYRLPYHVQPGFVAAVVSHGRMLRYLGRN